MSFYLNYHKIFIIIICLGCVLESPRRGDSNTHPQHMTLWRNIEIKHFLSFYHQTSPILLYARCKSGVTFVRRCFREGIKLKGSYYFAKGLKGEAKIPTDYLIPKRSVAKINTQWHFKHTLLVQSPINYASFSKQQGTRTTYLNLSFPLLNCQVTVYLNSLLL